MNHSSRTLEDLVCHLIRVSPQHQGELDRLLAQVDTRKQDVASTVANVDNHGPGETESERSRYFRGYLQVEQQGVNSARDELKTFLERTPYQIVNK
jgi:hypothetical protein